MRRIWFMKLAPAARELAIRALTLPLLLLAHAPVQAAATTAEGYSLPQPGYVFSFPKDHGSHPDFKIEWWYITGHLETADKRRFGFQVTFFRSALQPPGLSTNGTVGEEAFGAAQIYLAHVALLDAKTKRFLSEERVNRNGWDAHAATGDLDVRNGNWTLRRVPEPGASERLVLQASVLGNARLQLELAPIKPRVIFGTNGVSRKGAAPSAASYYITFPRLRAQGTLTLEGQALPVRGEAWMDHEISSSQLDPHQVGWDWASIQLHDGRELMVYVMRTTEGTADAYSTLAQIEADGTLTQRGPDEFQWEVLRRWGSPHTGAVYPIEVRLRTVAPFSGSKLGLRLVPLADDQEIIGKIGGISYWEGACNVVADDGQVIGRAYLELTGYAESLQGRLK